MGFFSHFAAWDFFPRDFFPTGKNSYGIFKNSSNCINFVLLCSGQYFMYIISLAHQLYTIFIVLTVPCKLKCESGQQEKGKY